MEYKVINKERFSKTFVSGKFNIKKWGRQLTFKKKVKRRYQS